MRTIRQASIFLASPGDVSTERQHARDVVEELNRTVGANRGIHLNVVGWETDAAPDYGADAQALINGQIARMEEHDVFVGIMWNRFGSPTPRAGSGTAEEFERAVRCFERNGAPRIMFYFSQAPANLDLAAIEQKRQVLEFQQRLRENSLYWTYQTPQGFKDLFRRHLTEWMLSASNSETPAVSPAAASAAPTAEPAAPAKEEAPRGASSSGDWALVGERFMHTSRASERDGIVELILRPGDDEDDEALRQLARRGGTIGFAYQNQAGGAEVRSAERMSGPDGDTWALTLKPTRRDGFMLDMSFNGVSATDIAGMRARLILLDEAPPAKDQFLSAAVEGRMGGGGAVRRGLLRDLWAGTGKDPAIFLPLARLLAVYHLKTTGTVEQVRQLVLGPIDGGGLHVKFAGTRPRVYSNKEPDTITVEGICPL